MKSETWQTVEEHLLRALALEPEGRRSYLDQTFKDDAEKRRLLESMLLAAGEMGNFLELGAEPEWLDLPELEEGQQIGPYRIVQELGRGGMSVVYLAHQEEFGRQVALKVIKRGMDSNEVLRRFFSERRILANLQHPSIAQLYDGGTTENGLPYFVMEHIEGEAIDTYCDRNRLSIDDRLKLFRQVCSAVHHAHQNLVVHRDIKPGNILVTPHGLPKLLDFGIAKVLNPGLDPGGVQEPTAAWMRLMTPSYASPEQIRGAPITTASDVYSLGVLLFELLTGILPRRSEDLESSASGGPLEVGTPARPSSVVARAAEGESGLEGVLARGEARRRSPQKLAKRLRGDLDKITAKALRLDPKDRYGSVGLFAEDLRRSLAGLTIVAREDTFLYRAKTFLKRHRLAAVVGFSALSFILAFAVMSGVQAARVEHARLQTEQVSEFLVDIFDASAAGFARGDSISAQDLLERGSSRVDRELEDQPELQATLMETIGQAYANLRSFDAAIGHFERALEVRNQLPGKQVGEVAESLRRLGVAQTGAGLYDESEGSFEQALVMLRARDGAESLEMAAIFEGLARLRSAQGRFAEAVELARRTVRIRRETLDDGHKDSIFSLILLAESLIVSGAYGEAETTLRQAISACREHLEDHPELARALNSLGYLLVDRGALDEAASPILESLEMRRLLFGEKHPIYAESLAMLGFLNKELGRFQEAIPAYRKSLEIYRENFGPGHPSVARETFNLGEAVLENGDFAEAEELFRQTLEVAKGFVDPDHPRVANLRVSLGVALHAQGKLEEAEAELELARAALLRSVGEEHPFLALARLELAALKTDEENFDGALELLEKVLPILEKVFGNDHWRLAQAKGELARALIGIGELAEARTLLEESEPILKSRRGAQDWVSRRAAATRSHLEEALAASQRTLIVSKQKL